MYHTSFSYIPRFISIVTLLRSFILLKAADTAEVTLSSFLRNQPWAVCRECEEPSFFLEVWLQTPHYFAGMFLIAINRVSINWCPLEFYKISKLPIICNFVIAISRHKLKLHLYIFPTSRSWWSYGWNRLFYNGIKGKISQKMYKCPPQSPVWKDNRQQPQSVTE